MPLRSSFLKRSTGQQVKGHFFGASDHTLYYMIADDTRLRPHRCKRHTASKSLICLNGYTLLVIQMCSGITRGSREFGGELVHETVCKEMKIN